MAQPKAPRPVLDKEGQTFGLLDYRTPEHIEVLVGGTHAVRVARAHFVGAAQGEELRLTVRSDDVFKGRRATTIDGIDLGPVVEVVRSGGAIEAIVTHEGGEAMPLAIPLAFVREVTEHIILEPSQEEVVEAQAEAMASPTVRAAVARHAPGAKGRRANVK